MKPLPNAREVAAAARQDCTAAALVESALDWSPCFVPGGIFCHHDFNLSLWRRLRDERTVRTCAVEGGEGRSQTVPEPPETPPDAGPAGANRG